MKKKFYVGIHNDTDVCQNSSSGGAFTAITDYIFDLNKNTVIYGCILDQKLEAIHIRGTSKNDRDKMRGSKYISSKLVGIYNDVQNDLINNQFVIFTGTPCQIAALKLFLENKKIKMDNLITIDFICHGVGDSNFFKDYIKHLEKVYKSEAISCKFRGKTKPGKFQDMVVEFKNKKKYIASTTNLDWFYSIYLSNLILKEGCYNCKFVENKHSDITLADDWSINRDKLNAHSLIITNTNKGDKIVKSLLNFNFKEINENEINQPNSKHATLKPENYEEFWLIYKKNGYLAAQKYFGNNTLKGKIKVCIANIIDRLNLRKLIKK